jgi:menaquinone-dependent protoporphyrinogen oxidase
MKKIAIVIATRYGQTEKIGRFIANRLTKSGTHADVFNVETRDLCWSIPEGYEEVLVGAPVYAGSFPAALVAWVRHNASSLNSMPCGFFTVSLNAADRRPQAREMDDRLLSGFLENTGLRPRFVASLAGKLHFRKYNFFIRWVMKKISRSAGGPTDTSRDHEMTDWSQVAAFTDAFADRELDSPFATATRLSALEKASVAGPGANARMHSAGANKG